MVIHHRKLHWNFSVQPFEKLIEFHKGIPRSRNLQFYDLYLELSWAKEVDIGLFTLFNMFQKLILLFC